MVGVLAMAAAAATAPPPVKGFEIEVNLSISLGRCGRGKGDHDWGPLRRSEGPGRPSGVTLCGTVAGGVAIGPGFVRCLRGQVS